MSESVSSVADESSVSSSSSTSKLETSANSKVESSTTSTAASSVKPAETSATNETTSKVEENVTSASSTETSSKPVEKPMENTTSATTSTTVEKPVGNTASTTTSTKVETPVEKPVETHTHSFSKATCEKPATCSCGATNGNPLGHNFTTANCVNPSTCKNCGITNGTTTNHNYVNGVCTVCRKNDPNYVAPHNCKTDGHTWGNSYTETETRTEEVIEYHDVTGTGYDLTLAMREFGTTINPADYGLNNSSTQSRYMKTTNTVNTTKYYHKCTKCGYTEMYNSSEEVIPSNVWERANQSSLSEYSVDTIWWDPNNIPQEAYDKSEKEQAALEEWLQTW